MTPSSIAPVRIIAAFAAFVVPAIVGLGLAPHAMAEPVLNSTSPYGFRRGTTSEISFAGGRLNEANVRLLSYTEGITLSDYQSEKPENATATLQVAETVPVGLHAIRLVSDRGISQLRLVHVGALPLIAEAEPNNQAEQAQRLDGDCTIAGVSLVRDEDWFEIEVPEGWRRLSVEAHGIRLGNQFYDPLIEVYGPDGALLERCDDTPLARQDPFIVIPAPQPGVYRVVIRDAMYRGRGDYRYLLHVGQFPRPSFSAPTGAPAGEEVQLSWFNQNSDSPAFTQTVQIASHENGTLDLTPEDEAGVAPSPVPFYVGSVVAAETEPNNGHGEANSIEWPQVVEGTLASAGDIDFYKFSAKKGQVVRFTVKSKGEVRSSVDAVVTVLNPQGGYIASNDDSGGPDSVLDYTATEDGDYFVSVRDFLRRGGAGYRYRLHISAPPRELALVLPERDRNRSIVVNVPQGNRMAVRVQANRTGIGGEVRLNVDNLPDGVSFESPKLAENRAQVPLLISATGESLPAASLARLAGTCTKDEQSVSGGLVQRQLLVAGDNNRDMWGFDIDRLAVAVTKASPFTIELVPPQVPIVQRGVMNLKIKAIREAGFEGPITIRSLYMPPGLSAKGRVTIPEKADSIEYALNANDKARLGTPQFAILAQAGHEGATVEVSSALVPINVVAPFVALKSQNVSLTQGGTAEMKMALTVNTPFEGMATAELLNLPNGVTADTVEFDKGQTELAFPIKAADDARVGRKGGLVCRVVVTQHGEPITHMIPIGQVRVDPPATSVVGNL